MDASNFIVTDDCGSPLGVMNIDLIQAEGTAMSYSLAAAAGDKDALDQIAAATLARIGAASFGYVAAVAAKQLAEGVVGPLLDVIDATRDATGVPAQDLRAGLAEARDFSMAVAATLAMDAKEGRSR
ncbi:hypothetical protein [Nocardioides nitrophenolicus]|uniref:hypothetical protein n=1 Tax=Nocardioides nitrophenolicus TaxID=60489 RepID=UPI001956CA43|nr:hypothetical protein [Nocardioides nitrophenolicus]MBM7518301.1 hypothetical protein [Nocardioides nitrophenolicus]